MERSLNEELGHTGPALGSCCSHLLNEAGGSPPEPLPALRTAESHGPVPVIAPWDPPSYL